MNTALQTLSSEISGLVSALAPSIVAVRSGRSQASGFVWRPGLIVTADERIDDENETTVTLPGGQAAAAVVVGRDATTDIALLRLTQADQSAVALSSDLPKSGDLVVAVGARAGRSPAALGIVSHSDGPWRSMRGGEIDARIELDLRLPRGGDGSVAVDTSGRVLGMIVTGARRSVLVIPAATVDRVATKLQEHGRIPRGYLGLGLHMVAVGESKTGAMVMNVDPSGPGAAAGFHQGDVIVSWNGKAMGRLQELLRSLGPDSVGRTVTFDVRRGGQIHQAALTIAERPSA